MQTHGKFKNCIKFAKQKVILKIYFLIIHFIGKF